jgi:UDP-N-acetylmuramoyl-tripeptide--D-alanyl-D-alanine ligase
VPVVTAGQLAAWSGGRVVGDPGARAHGMGTDSRSQQRGVAFAAVRGERVDGHDYVRDAVDGGAPFVVVEREDAVPAGATAIVVDDTVSALGMMATHVRREIPARVIGITGSTGKTLTKDFVAAAMSSSVRVYASPGNLNTEVGLPLVLLGAPSDASVIVAELGARGPGQIAELCDMARPSVGAITGIGSAHLEVFRTRDTIARTKSELLRALPADGLGSVPSDDDFLATFASSTAARLACVGPGAAVSYRADRITPDGLMYGRIAVYGRSVPVGLPVPGRALMRNAAFAVRIAMEFGVDPDDAATGIADAALTSWRLQIVSAGERTIVNDAYNSNPTSIAATLRSGRELAGDRPVWAVLGRMAELGDATEDEHRRAGRLAVALGYSGLVVVGAEAAGIAAGARGLAQTAASIEEAADVVRSVVPSGAVVVVKGSRAVGLEHLVEQLVSAQRHRPAGSEKRT